MSVCLIDSDELFIEDALLRLGLISKEEHVRRAMQRILSDQLGRALGQWRKCTNKRRYFAP